MRTIEYIAAIGTFTWQV